VEGLLKDDALKQVFFGQVDFEKVNDVAKAAKVVGFPTIVLFRDGKEEARLNGQGHSAEKIRSMLLELL
jgi:thioredoxin-like negative regulator of GroEL